MSSPYRVGVGFGLWVAGLDPFAGFGAVYDGGMVVE
jgi:hypothetical protein